MPDVSAASLPGNKGSLAVFNPAATSAPTVSAAPPSSTFPSTGNFIPRNPVTGAADYTAVTAPQTGTGVMNAAITQPSANAPKSPAPVVLTSGPADSDLASKQSTLAQINADTAAHKAAMAAPTNPQTTTTTTQPTTTPTVGGTGSIDDQINSKLNELTGNLQTVDTNTASTLSPLNDEAATIQAEKDAASVTALDQLRSIAAGTYPLTPSESALLDATKASYLNTIQGQTMANASFTGQMTELAASLGISTSAPTQALGLIHEAISTGNDKVAALNGQMAQSLATVQQGFLKNDFDMVQSAWDETAKAFDDRLTAISDMQKAVTDAATAQKADLKDTTKLVLSTMMDSAKFTYQQKQDTIDNAFKASQINETQRHDFATEAISKENADNAGSASGTFTKTQTNKGAATAGVDVDTFSGYPVAVKNYFINSPTQAAAFNGLVADRQAGKTSSKDVADTISTSNVPEDVKTWMYQTAGVDENGNPTDGKKDSGLVADLSAAGNFLGDSYGGVKNFLGIQ